jgi:predicted HAD superfamily Cof-like phosphohydrolase
MSMNQDVVKFIQACDQARKAENETLYLNLIDEEYTELKESTSETDELDACMDLIWVILGYCYMKGFDVEGAWAEVARSNLSKIDSETGKVIRREDGKILKPLNWSPPELDKFIAK